jgi:hypothetical protein
MLQLKLPNGLPTKWLALVSVVWKTLRPRWNLVTRRHFPSPGCCTSEPCPPPARSYPRPRPAAYFGPALTLGPTKPGRRQRIRVCPASAYLAQTNPAIPLAVPAQQLIDGLRQSDFTVVAIAQIHTDLQSNAVDPDPVRLLGF